LFEAIFSPAGWPLGRSHREREGEQWNCFHEEYLLAGPDAADKEFLQIMKGASWHSHRSADLRSGSASTAPHKSRVGDVGDRRSTPRYPAGGGVPPERGRSPPAARRSVEVVWSIPEPFHHLLLRTGASV